MVDYLIYCNGIRFMGFISFSSVLLLAYLFTPGSLVVSRGYIIVGHRTFRVVWLVSQEASVASSHLTVNLALVSPLLMNSVLPRFY